MSLSIHEKYKLTWPAPPSLDEARQILTEWKWVPAESPDAHFNRFGQIRADLSKYVQDREIVVDTPTQHETWPAHKIDTLAEIFDRLWPTSNQINPIQVDKPEPKKADEPDA